MAKLRIKSLRQLQWKVTTLVSPDCRSLHNGNTNTPTISLSLSLPVANANVGTGQTDSAANAIVAQVQCQTLISMPVVATHACLTCILKVPVLEYVLEVHRRTRCVTLIIQTPLSGSHVRTGRPPRTMPCHLQSNIQTAKYQTKLMQGGNPSEI